MRNVHTLSLLHIPVVVTWNYRRKLKL